MSSTVWMAVSTVWARLASPRASIASASASSAKATTASTAQTDAMANTLRPLNGNCASGNAACCHRIVGDDLSISFAASRTTPAIKLPSLQA